MRDDEEEEVWIVVWSKSNPVWPATKKEMCEVFVAPSGESGD